MLRWRRRRGATWDLTALLNAAEPQATLPERHLWLIRLLQWLRHAPSSADLRNGAGPEPGGTPLPVLRLRHLLNVLDRHPPHRARVAAVLLRFWNDVDIAALFADFGFAPRTHFLGELGQRLRSRVLPLNPATPDLGELFGLLFPRTDDASWLEVIDEATLVRLMSLVARPAQGTDAAAIIGTGAGAGDAAAMPDGRRWMAPLLDAIVFLGSSVRAAGFSSSLRPRMSQELLATKPFRQLGRVAEQVSERVPLAADPALLPEVQYLRALLDTCRQCADSVQSHLEEHGVSINVVFEADQLRERTRRMEQLLNCVVSPSPVRDLTLLLADMVRASRERRSVQRLFARHYSLLARKVAERSADTGHRYITRDVPEYMAMLRAALGGGAVLGVTTVSKFFLTAMALSLFWSGLAVGVNYALSFVLIYILHGTIATKQPAMTAPAMAEKLRDVSEDDAVEGFVDEVAHLIRSQAAGVFGNLMAVTPMVLTIQWGSRALLGEPLIGHRVAEKTLQALTLLGPTPVYAACTGVLLFVSSLIAGWVENWFVLHQLESAIGWNPVIVDRLGAVGARRIAQYWRRHISGWASNIALGMMLGLVPVVAAFFGVPLEVRHVTISTGQLAAALGSEGAAVLHRSDFWWSLAGIPATALLNITVSFFLAFKVALRSRGIRWADRSRIYRAIRRRLRRRPLSFLLPPRAPRAAVA